MYESPLAYIVGAATVVTALFAVAKYIASMMNRRPKALIVDSSRGVDNLVCSMMHIINHGSFPIKIILVKAPGEMLTNRICMERVDVSRIKNTGSTKLEVDIAIPPGGVVQFPVYFSNPSEGLRFIPTISKRTWWNPFKRQYIVSIFQDA